MNKDLILEDWTDYDNKKIRDQRDGRFFSCEEKWEVDYLVDKINKRFPSISRKDIHIAILSCCQTISAPRPRVKFVECVLNGLGLKM